MEGYKNIGMTTQAERLEKALKSMLEKTEATQIEEDLKELGIDVKNKDGSFKTLDGVLREISDLMKN